MIPINIKPSLFAWKLQNIFAKTSCRLQTEGYWHYLADQFLIMGSRTTDKPSEERAKYTHCVGFSLLSDRDYISNLLYGVYRHETPFWTWPHDWLILECQKHQVQSTSQWQNLHLILMHLGSIILKTPSRQTPWALWFFCFQASDSSPPPTLWSTLWVLQFSWWAR